MHAILENRHDGAGEFLEFLSAFVEIMVERKEAREYSLFS
jgi:hypothetical protein